MKYVEVRFTAEDLTLPPASIRNKVFLQSARVVMTIDSRVMTKYGFETIRERIMSVPTLHSAN